jgi:serine/threonine protein kinase
MSGGGSRRRFKFIREIAEGGFGKVYLAEQITHDGFSRVVAIKLLHSQFTSNAEIVMRTRDEARLLGLIRHPHIVKVEDLTSIDGKCAIVMEYLEGVDLKELIAHFRQHGGHFPVATVAEVMIAVSAALDAAYYGLPLQGGAPLQVIHRDIKPSNILVTTAGAVKVLDFGTARANFAEREAKTQALAFGSSGYMAPERMMGETDTPAGDVFSLGITLYELLALESFGKLPARQDKFEKKLAERLDQLQLNGAVEVQQRARDVVRRMMSYEPTERPRPSELAESFEFLLEHTGDDSIRKFGRTVVAAVRAGVPERPTRDPLVGREIEEDHVGGSGATATRAAVNPTPPSNPAPAATRPVVTQSGARPAAVEARAAPSTGATTLSWIGAIGALAVTFVVVLVVGIVAGLVVFR